ncbi:MAG: UvrD-helicase domain-containing protein [Bacteroidales bacterium]|jgi:DNA helicase-4|nr:UvrD-helicase domain-containing protein [Bacteroidales bacterium]
MKTDLSQLNDKQKEAVLCENKRLLVLAGAGSGKTKTLLQKILFLIEEKAVNPGNILAITFTKNAANEMLDRLIISADKTNEYSRFINDKKNNQSEIERKRIQYKQKYKWINNLTIKTFHSLCYRILRNYGVNEFDNQFKIVTDKVNPNTEFTKYSATETSFDILNKLLIKKCESKIYLLSVKRYLIDYMVDKIHEGSNNLHQKYPNGKFYTSLNGCIVRSKSEQYIADWLYRHNIKFEYEPSVNFSDFSFHPDFYIPEANVYLEHVSDKSYPTKAKEEQFRKANKLLVKTFESQTKNTALFNLALERIVKNRLPADYHYNSALSFEEEFRTHHDDIKRFLRAVMQIIDMIKVENIPLDKVFEDSQNDQHERVRNFYRLAIPLVRAYKDYCTNKSYLDFNDMINKTIDLFKHRTEIVEKFQKQYEYILVDEFQDVNNLQVELLKHLLTKKNNLFCVGDDWQSIYGFRGSNVDYIINFVNHFNGSKIIKLDQNYRSTQHIVSASNEVIKHNKHKLDKELHANKNSNQKIEVYAGVCKDDQVDYAIKQVRKLNADGYSKEDILFLYRRNRMFTPFFEQLREEKLQFTGKTIHASKGLEAKAVFIIGLTEGGGGFPDIWMEDRIYQVIKESNHELLLEEERRLFYVAITRAREQLFLLTEVGNESSFLKEIPENYLLKSADSFMPISDDVLLCKHCQKPIEKGFAFCPHCGGKLG